MTLASLMEEKSNLDDKIKILGDDEETRFDLELVNKNISMMQEKIKKA